MGSFDLMDRTDKRERESWIFLSNSRSETIRFYLSWKRISLDTLKENC